MISVTGLVKTFGMNHVLTGLSLEAAEGECIVLRGPNGSGKSTLVRCIARLIDPTAGEVLLEGRGHVRAEFVGPAVAAVSPGDVNFSVTTPLPVITRSVKAATPLTAWMPGPFSLWPCEG